MAGETRAATGHLVAKVGDRFARLKCRSKRDYYFFRPMARFNVDKSIVGPPSKPRISTIGLTRGDVAGDARRLEAWKGRPQPLLGEP